MLRRGYGGIWGLGIPLLAMELLGFGIPNIPPVTLGFIAFNAAIYLRILRIARSVGHACTSVQHVVQLGQWKRILLASFFHLDSMHLYFNMVSFLWKGRTLERRFGGRKFFIIVVMFAILSQILLLFLNFAFSILLFNRSYLTTCAAGFSAVVFALKVLTTHNMWQESVYVIGLPITVPAQFACWIELVLIQILVPNASFTGHLAGILVGMAFVHGPLHKMANTIDRKVAYYLGQLPPLAVGQQANTNRYTYRSGPSGYRNNRANEQNRHHDGYEEEQIQEAIRRSLQDQHPSRGEDGSVRSRHHQSQNLPYGWNLSGLNEDDYPRNPYPPGAQYPQHSFTSHAQSSNSLPYPAEDNYRMPYPNGGIYPNLDAQGFGTEAQQDSNNKMPSAPPAPELFSVD